MAVGSLNDLLKMVEDGKAQLLVFQRSWVWDGTKICKLIEGITFGFPMGTTMFLANGGEQVRFSYRKFEGVTSPEEVTTEWLVLDGSNDLLRYISIRQCDFVLQRTNV